MHTHIYIFYTTYAYILCIVAVICTDVEGPEGLQRETSILQEQCKC